MSVVRAAASTLSATLLFWSAPAQACVTNWWIDFRRGLPVPTKDGNESLIDAAVTLKTMSSDDAVKVVVYNPGASSPALWKARIAEARLRLLKYGVAENRITVVPVRTRGGMVAGQWVGRKTGMMVDLVKGCGG